ncbi:MAG: DUF5996 family protein [Planctomycetota bacterium]
MLPPLPLASWKPTKETLHIFVQIVGKIRLTLAPARNHWWHVTSRPSCFGISLPSASVHPSWRSPTTCRSPSCRLLPTKVTQPTTRRRLRRWDDLAVDGRGARALRWPIQGEDQPVHFFWHGFDLALTRFSGRPAPPIPGANAVTRAAYSHEVASFGFWPGDANVPAPAFYAYASPVAYGLRDEPLQPRGARWNSEGGQARLSYAVVRRSQDPAKTLTEFWESVDRAARARACWSAAQPHDVAQSQDSE